MLPLCAEPLGWVRLRTGGLVRRQRQRTIPGRLIWKALDQRLADVRVWLGLESSGDGEYIGQTAAVRTVGQGHAVIACGAAGPSDPLCTSS